MNLNSLINSDNNYLKIVAEGTLQLAEAGATAVVSHNLGYPPIVRAYFQIGDEDIWYQHVYLDLATNQRLFALTTGFYATNDTVVFNSGLIANIKMHYRIYDRGEGPLTSDTNIDKVFMEGTQTFEVDRAQTLSVPHGQSQAPLWTFQYSLDGVDWYSENVPIFDSEGDLSSGLSVYGWTDNQNLYLYAVNSLVGTKTVRVRYVLDVA